MTPTDDIHTKKYRYQSHPQALGILKYMRHCAYIPVPKSVPVATVELLTQDDVHHPEHVMPERVDRREVVPVLRDDVQHIGRSGVRHPGVRVEHPAELLIAGRYRKCLAVYSGQARAVKYRRTGWRYIAGRRGQSSAGGQVGQKTFGEWYC